MTVNLSFHTLRFHTSALKGLNIVEMKLTTACQTSDENRHVQDIESVVLFGNRVFSAADDGKVKVWSTQDLSLLHEFLAHDYAIFHLMIVGDRLYTASIDQSIKSWQLDTWKLVATFTGHENTPRRLYAYDDFIYSGDEGGEVLKWTKDGELSGKYDVVEEVWDLCICKGRLYTIRDRGLTITELKGKADEKKQHVVCCTVEGRSPLHVTEKYIFMVNRSGVNVDQYSNTPPKCEYASEMKGHDKIITALSGWGDYLVSGGWDEKIVIWNVEEGTQIVSTIIPGCPNAIAVFEGSSIFVGGADGFLVKINISS